MRFDVDQIPDNSTIAIVTRIRRCQRLCERGCHWYYPPSNGPRTGCPRGSAAKALTTKNLGDAAEHYALSQFAFAGMPGTKMPDNWKGYDLAVETGDGLQRVSVKLRSESVRRKLGNAAGVFADLVTVRIGGSAMSGILSGIAQAVRWGGIGFESLPDGSRRTDFGTSGNPV